MGCGGSKLDPAQDMLPPKLRPLLRKRFEEIRRRRRWRRKGCTLKDQTTLSRKELLDSNVSDDDGNDGKSVSSDEDNVLMKVAPAPPESDDTMAKDTKIVKAVDIKPVFLVCPTFGTMLPVFDEPCKDIEGDVQVVKKVEVSADSKKQSKDHEVQENKQTKVTPHVEIVSMNPSMVGKIEADKLSTVEKSRKEDRNGEEIEEREKNVVVVETSEANVENVEVSETEGEEEEVTNDDEEEEAEDKCDSVNERLLCPGSPSFRIYCNQSDNDKDIEDTEDKLIDKKLQSEDTNGGDGIESVHSTTEESETEAKRKVKSGHRFRKVIPKAKPMKNLLKVQSCCNPACGGGHKKVRLFSSKSSAA